MSEAKCTRDSFLECDYAMSFKERVDMDELTFTDDYIYTYNDIPFTGVGYELGEDGRLISEVTYENGSDVGLAREWDENGQLIRERIAGRPGEKTTWKEWHPNGILKEEGESFNGRCVFVRQWDENGRLMREA